MNSNEEIVISTVGSIKKLLEPIYARLENIDSSIKNQVSGKTERKQYYRNQDLKTIFGLSNNTIIKYRETGILPYTKLGDIFLYDIKVIDKILNSNQV